MSHIPNSAMPHAHADDPTTGQQHQEQRQSGRFNADEWKTWGADQLSWAREQIAPTIRKVRSDPKLMAAVIGTLAVAALPLLRSRRHHALG